MDAANFISMQTEACNSIDAMDTLNARLAQVGAMLGALDLAFTSRESAPGEALVRNTLWGAQALLEQAREAAGQL